MSLATDAMATAAAQRLGQSDRGRRIGLALLKMIRDDLAGADQTNKAAVVLVATLARDGQVVAVINALARELEGD